MELNTINSKMRILLYFVICCICLNVTAYYYVENYGWDFFYEANKCHKITDATDTTYGIKIDDSTGKQIRYVYTTIEDCKSGALPIADKTKELHFERVDTFIPEKYYYCEKYYTDATCKTEDHEQIMLCAPKLECNYYPTAKNGISIQFHYGHDSNDWPAYITKESKNEFCLPDEQGWYDSNFWYLDHCALHSTGIYYKLEDMQIHENSTIEIAIILVLGCIALFL